MILQNCISLFKVAVGACAGTGQVEPLGSPDAITDSCLDADAIAIAGSGAGAGAGAGDFCAEIPTATES